MTFAHLATCLALLGASQAPQTKEVAGRLNDRLVADDGMAQSGKALMSTLERILQERQVLAAPSPCSRYPNAGVSSHDDPRC